MITPPLQSLSPLKILLHVIINQYLNSSYCITIVSEKCLNINVTIPFTYIAITESLEESLFDVSEKGCSDYIIQLKKPKYFMGALENVTHWGNARRSDRKLIFLPIESDTDATRELLGVLNMKETSFVANVLLILADREKTTCAKYDLVTHKFVGPGDEIFKPNYLDKWNTCTHSFERNSNLFPHDMNNLYGKIVKVACFTYKPYILLDLDRHKASLGRDGTEIRIVDEFCRWINCTIVLVRSDEDQWGKIYPNNTGVGVLGNVVEDRADLAITALYSWHEYYIHLDFSAASIRAAVTCIAPAPRLLNSWEVPLLPFAWHVWVAVVVTFFFTSFALILVQEFSIKKTFITTFAVMIAQSQDTADTTWRVRYVIAWILLAGLVLTNAYGAGLASTFTVPNYGKSIDTIQDMIDNNVEWGATHGVWIYSLTHSEEPTIKKLVHLFTIYNDQELQRRSVLGKMAFGIEKLQGGHYAIGEYITKETAKYLMIMLEDFYYDYSVVMMRKSSPFTNKISAFIGRLHETGLLLAWETQVNLMHLDNKVQLEVRLSRSGRDHEVVPLSFRHVVGIFFIYSGGIIISTIIFLMELYANKKNKLFSKTRKMEDVHNKV